MNGILYFTMTGTVNGTPDGHMDYIAVAAEDHEQALPLMRMVCYCPKLGGVVVGRGAFSGDTTLVTEAEIARRAITEDAALTEFLAIAQARVLTIPAEAPRETDHDIPRWLDRVMAAAAWLAVMQERFTAAVAVLRGRA